MSKPLQDNVATSHPDFDSFANMWLDAVRAKIIEPQLNKEWRENHGVEQYKALKVEPTGTAYLRIWSQTSTTGRHDEAGRGSAWAFIALKDGETKGMGRVRRGDIFKPDSWKKPAKHARGNIFEPGEDGCCGVTAWTGPNYIR